MYQQIACLCDRGEQWTTCYWFRLKTFADNGHVKCLILFFSNNCNREYYYYSRVKRALKIIYNTLVGNYNFLIISI